MARPRSKQPTPAELEVLKVVWERGPSTVRDVMEALNRRGPQRAYTSVMSLLVTMAEKKLLKRKAEGRAFLYSARHGREKTLNTILGDVLARAFDGSANSLVAHLLANSSPSAEELDEIRRTIDSYPKQ